jgi:signal transduction histidine kinase
VPALVRQHRRLRDIGEAWTDPAALYVRWIRLVGPVVVGAWVLLLDAVADDAPASRSFGLASIASGLVVGGAARLLVPRLGSRAVVRMLTWFDVVVLAWLVSSPSDAGAASLLLLWPIVVVAMLLTPLESIATAFATVLLTMAFALARDAAADDFRGVPFGVLIVALLLAALRGNEHRATAERREMALQLDAAQRLAKVGSFEYRMGESHVSWSRQTRRLYGVADDAELSVEMIRELVREEDIPALGVAFRGALERQEPFELDVGISRADDGGRRVLHMVGRGVEGPGAPRLIGTVQDVTDLRRLDAMREEFVAAASHELRTPTSIVLGFATTLTSRWDELSEQDRRRFAGEIDEAARRLSLLVEDVLQATQIEASTVSCRHEPFDLRAEVLDVVATWPGQLPVEVAPGSAPGAARVIGDPIRTRQVLGNLLDNAERHAHGATRVRIELATDDGSVQVRVSDDGVGIAVGDRERIFERFVRLDRSVIGTGLGLYISRRLAEAQDGSLEASIAPGGRGATFTYSLPADPDRVEP